MRSIRSASRRRNGEVPKFVFLAHWVEPWNWLLWFFPWLHSHPNGAFWFKPLILLYLPVSFLYMVGKTAFNLVDRFLFGRMTGETWLLRNFGYHFLSGKQRTKIKRRIKVAVQSAAEAGIAVVGLGALTKAEFITKGGRMIVDDLDDLLTEQGTCVVHGDTLTAATVIYQVRQLIDTYDLHGQPVFVSGGTSKIGRAVALALAATDNIEVKLLTGSRKRFDALASESGERHVNLTQVRGYDEATDCPIWITGKAERGADKKILRHAPQGAVIINFSVPDPLSPRLLRRRPDIRHFDGGLLAYDHAQTTLKFTMRLIPGITYACHAGTITHAFMGWQFHEVDQVDLARLDETWQAAQQAGFFLPPPMSFLRAVSVQLSQDATRPLWQGGHVVPRPPQSAAHLPPAAGAAFGG